LISCAMQGRGLCSASWMCHPVSFDGRAILVRKPANLFGYAWTRATLAGPMERTAQDFSGPQSLAWTSVVGRLERVAEAGRLLVSRVLDFSPDHLPVHLPTDLIVRESCGG